MTASLPEVARYITAKHGRFVPFVSQTLDGNHYQATPFDDVINDAIDRTFTGEITRLIVNIPPGHGKTLRAVWAYVARGFALNPSARFIHASYSDKLVQDNSSRIRDVINSHDYQTLFPYVSFKEDAQAKGLWKTSAGGSFLASPSGGAITGFRAGLVGSDIWSGSMIIDDPLKPDDALSETKRHFINQRWHNTFKSRLAHNGVPVIVIMQRIHEDDFTTELLDRSGEEWHHLVLPAYVDNSREYTQSGKLIEYDLPDGSLWPAKHSDTQALALMGSIQYSQEPTPAKGEVYEREWFRRYDALPPNIKSWSIYCDTASKVNKYSDYTVFQLWAKCTSNHGWLVDQFRGRERVPEIKGKLLEFYDRALVRSGQHKIKINIEDKDSGVGLIQSLEDDRKYSVSAIQRREGKYARALRATPHVQAGHIHMPRTSWADGLITEATKFKADDSHAHDDQIDPLNDFINYELPKLGYSLENIL